jgi:protein-S-isoprenylcysteine O-methyltransferase Ste14
MPEGAPDPRLRGALDVAERAFAVVLFVALVQRFLATSSLSAPTLGTVLNLSILTTEGLVTVLILARRRALDMSVRPLDWVIALVGVCAPMLVLPAGPAVAPPILNTGLALWGLLFSFWGQLALWRSFGLVAANRGVVRHGPYAFVRHPIYSGYLFTYVGFALAHFSARNVAVELCAIVIMIVRIMAEERVLSADPAYAEFMARVRFRLIPGLF